MSARRMVSRASAVTVVTLGAVLALLVIPVGVASAATARIGDAGGVATPSSDTPVPAVLATTGLDLATPIIVGLSILVLGTALVAWAVLRGSRGARGAHDGTR